MLLGRMLWLDDHSTRASALGIARHHRNSGTNNEPFSVGIAVTSREVVRCLGGSVDRKEEHKQPWNGARTWGTRLAERRLQKTVVPAAGQPNVQQLLVLRHKLAEIWTGVKAGAAPGAEPSGLTHRHRMQMRWPHRTRQE
jgi:hypothetical protein